MKRHLTATLLALAASLTFCSSALGAVTLSFSEAQHTPAVVNKGDEILGYTVRLKNAGTTQLGDKLTCNTATGNWANAAGFAYQWLRDGAAIAAATTTEYTTQVADQGHAVQCRVIATNAGATSSSAAVTAPTVVAPIPSPAPPSPLSPSSESSRPTITGTGVAERACVVPTSWSGAPAWTFQWLRNGAPIPSAITQNYLPGAEDANKVLQCMTIGANAGGSAIAISANSAVGSPSSPPSNSAAATPRLNGPAWTSGATNLSVSLPAGVRLAFGEGSGWSCHINAQICVYSPSSPENQIAPGGEFPQLKLEAWVYPEEAPQETITTSFSAFGGGATGPDAITQESFALGPEKPFGLETFTAKTETDAGGDYTTAGGHPFKATTVFQIPTHTTSLRQGGGEGRVVPVENLRDAYFELPAGFIGNPEAADICAFAQVSDPVGTCPASAAVGGIRVEFAGSGFGENVPIFRIFPEQGYAAAFAFRPLTVSTLTVVLRAKLRSNGDYGVTAASPLPPQTPPTIGVGFATLCSYGVKTLSPNRYAGCRTPAEAGPATVPFLTNPTRCAGAAPVTVAHADSYQHTGAQTEEGFPDLSDPNWKSKEALAPATTDCTPLTEAWTGLRKPSLSFRPDSTRAAAPAAYSAHLHIPQDGLLEEGGLATAHLDNTTVTLPAGIALNPSAASGLGACSEAQAGYLGNGFGAPNPMHFSTTAAGCPGDSKIGNVKVSTPILGPDLPGSVYLAAQDANPFGSKFAIYLVVEDKESGIHATLAGKVSPDPATGQITTTFTNNPQAPLEDVQLEFFGGPRASLANPDVCAAYATSTALTPWSAADPDNPTASETAISKDTVAIDGAPEGQGTCATTKAGRPFGLGFEAGSANPQAGAHSPFSLRITRPVGDQELSRVTVSTPPGFAATLKGVGICSEAALAAAAGRTGAAELANPSCPAASQVGTTTIGAGAGPTPYYVKTGKVYLTGPYKGAPLSLSFIVPAVAGPFDLGVQVVRTALYVDPKTAQVTAKSDPIPQILDGVPLNIRDVRVDLNPGFALNPTNCEAMAISGQASGSSGAVANLSNRFQVGGCEHLKFKPNLKIQLHGGTRRSDYQRLSATVSYPEGPGYANIARAAVTLPHSEFLAQEHIGTVCTRVQFAAHACPAASVYGHAEAVSPLLDGKLAGPVYLRSSDNLLPDLVAALRGPDAQPIEVELSGRTDSVHGGIRNTFDLVPDAPVSKFTLQLFGGRKSLIVNSRNICKEPQRATVVLSAQNGLQRNFRPVVGNDCGKKGRTGKKGQKSR